MAHCFSELAPDRNRRRLLDGVHGGRKADALRAPLGQGIEPRQRESQVTPALVTHERVDLVDDDGAHAAQEGARTIGGEHQIQRLGGRDEHVRRTAHDGGARRSRSIPGPQGGTDGWRREAELHRRRADAFQRDLEVLLNVAAQRLERRDIDDLDAATEGSRQCILDEAIEAGEECGQGLT